MKNRLSWTVWPALALLAACSAPEGPGPRNPTSASWPEAGQTALAFSASQLSCTLTQGFWKNHPDAWPAEITMGGVTYTAAEAMAILSMPPRGDARYILAHQLIAAMLNVYHGADDADVADAIAAADAWLADNPLDTPFEGDREEGIELAETLDDYNNGVIGPGHCDEPTPLPTPTPEPSPSPMIEPS